MKRTIDDAGDLASCTANKKARLGDHPTTAINMSLKKRDRSTSLSEDRSDAPKKARPSPPEPPITTTHPNASAKLMQPKGLKSAKASTKSVSSSGYIHTWGSGPVKPGFKINRGELYIEKRSVTGKLLEVIRPASNEPVSQKPVSSNNHPLKKPAATAPNVSSNLTHSKTSKVSKTSKTDKVPDMPKKAVSPDKRETSTGSSAPSSSESTLASSTSVQPESMTSNSPESSTENITKARKPDSATRTSTKPTSASSQAFSAAIPNKAINALEKVTFPPTPPAKGVSYKKKLEKPDWIYYKNTVKKVAVGDLVMRERTPSQLEKGMADKNDIFDGPWRIERFHHTVKWTKPDKIYPGKSEDIRMREEEEYMLSQKVELNFPDIDNVDYYGVKSPHLVEIGQLRPLYHNVPAGARIRANGPNIATREDFIRLTKSGKTEEVGRKSVDEPEIGTKPLYFAHLNSNRFLAVEEEIEAQKDVNGGVYEKLRGKRIRVLSPDHKDVVESGIESDVNDKWVQALLKKDPDRYNQKILAVEYLVHWAGWSDEFDTWEYAECDKEEIDQRFIKDYETRHDMRVKGKKVKDLAYEE